jgi:hypothetical protein
LAVKSLAALEEHVQAVYDDANAYADQVGGVEYGMNILLGPPIVRPLIMIVSLQGAGADKTIQRTWPKELLYSQPALDVNPRDGRPNGFGQRLRKDFEARDMSEVLQTRVAASNIVFPQWPNFSEWCGRGTLAAGWNSRSRKWLIELIQAMAPKVILTYGAPAFQVLTGQQKRKKELGRGVFGGTPVIGCGHLMRGADLRERDEAMIAIIDEIELCS